MGGRPAIGRPAPITLLDQFHSDLGEELLVFLIPSHRFVRLADLDNHDGVNRIDTNELVAQTQRHEDVAARIGPPSVFEPRRACQRLIGFSYAATASVSRAA